MTGKQTRRVAATGAWAQGTGAAGPGSGGVQTGRVAATGAQVGNGARPRRIVILGGGYGGAYCAQSLEKRLRRAGLTRATEVLLLDRNNFFVAYPLLVEAGTGSLEPRHAVIALRAFLKTTHFKQAEATGVDRAARRVTYRVVGSQQEESVEYDHLVVAVGSVTRWPPVPGLDRFGLELKTLADAVALRDRAIWMLERADATADSSERAGLLHFVVVGGNFTGAEVAGEFHVLLREAARLYPNLRPSDCKVTLVEIGDRILGALDADLAEYARRQMERRGMSVRLRTSVSEIREREVVLDNGEVLPALTVIWCAGIAPNPLIAKLGLPVDRLGYIVCDRELRAQGHSDVWAIGDCAICLDRDGKPTAATAQRAVQQGEHLGRSLARVLQGEPAPVFVYAPVGALAALGCRTGVARLFGVKLSGFWAWALWRTVYLLKMPGWSRRARIALDWSIDLVFRREYVQLGVHKGRHGA
jgi:NADH dehydrogenase